VGRGCDALYEVAMAAAVAVTVTVSCKIIAAKKHRMNLMTSSTVACVVVGDWLKPLKQF